MNEILIPRKFDLEFPPKGNPSRLAISTEANYTACRRDTVGCSAPSVKMEEGAKKKIKNNS